MSEVSAGALATLAAEVRDFDPTRWLGDKGLRSLDRLTKLVVVACRLAAHDAGLKRDGAFVTARRTVVRCRGRIGQVESRIRNAESNAIDLRPGVVLGLRDHPQRTLGEDRRWLIVGARLAGVVGGRCAVEAQARRADAPGAHRGRRRRRRVGRLRRPHADRQV